MSPWCLWLRTVRQGARAARGWGRRTPRARAGPHSSGAACCPWLRCPWLRACTCTGGAGPWARPRKRRQSDQGRPGGVAASGKPLQRRQVPSVAPRAGQGPRCGGCDDPVPSAPSLTLVLKSFGLVLTSVLLPRFLNSPIKP